MRETWYVLEDGSVVDPREVSPDKGGKLVHSGGVAVAMRGDVPHTSGVDADDERAEPKAARGTSKDMKPGDHRKRYKTRESKAD